MQDMWYTYLFSMSLKHSFLYLMLSAQKSPKVQLHDRRLACAGANGKDRGKKWAILNVQNVKLISVKRNGKTVWSSSYWVMIFMCWLMTIINEQNISSVYVFTCKVKCVFFDIKTFCSEIPILYTGHLRQTEKYDADKQLIYLFTSAEKCFEHQVLGFARQPRAKASGE